MVSIFYQTLYCLQKFDGLNFDGLAGKRQNFPLYGICQLNSASPFTHVIENYDRVCAGSKLTNQVKRLNYTAIAMLQKRTPSCIATDTDYFN